MNDSILHSSASRRWRGARVTLSGARRFLAGEYASIGRQRSGIDLRETNLLAVFAIAMCYRGANKPCRVQQPINERMEFAMNIKNMFLLVAVLGMAGCEAIDQGYFPGGRMRIVSATYGLNCGAPRGNATWHIAEACDGTSNCNYPIDVNALGDPSVGCPKTYAVEYRCAGGATRTASAAEGAGPGTIVTLQCTN